MQGRLGGGAPAWRTTKEFSVSKYPARYAVNRRSASEVARRIANGDSTTSSRLVETNPRRRSSSQAPLTSSTLRADAEAHVLRLVTLFAFLLIWLERESECKSA